MTTTVVEIEPRGDSVSCALSGDLVVPRLVRRRGRAVEVALVAGRAMLLPGDAVRLRIGVGAGCALSLVDIGGLVVYGRPGEAEAASQWHALIEIGDEAHLTWEGLPTVITDAGTLERSLTIRLGRGASALLRETLVLGRTGERGGRLRADTDIADPAGPLLRETFDAMGSDPVPGILGDARVMDTVVALGPTTGVAEVDGATRLDLARGGSMLRHLGSAAHESPLAGAWPDRLGRREGPDSTGGSVALAGPRTTERA